MIGVRLCLNDDVLREAKGHHVCAPAMRPVKGRILRLNVPGWAIRVAIAVGTRPSASANPRKLTHSQTICICREPQRAPAETTTR